METTLSHGCGDAYGQICANQVAEIRADIGQTKSDLRDSISDTSQHLQNRIGDFEGKISAAVFQTNKSVGEAQCAIMKDASDISQRNTIHLNSIERDLQNRILENRSIITQHVSDKADRILDRIDRDGTDLKNQMRDFEMRNAEKLCDLKTVILDRLTTDKLDEKNQKINELLNEKHADKHAYNFALQSQEISSLKQMINSVEQTQRFSSKTVQFGTGNLAGTAQTANQG